MEPILVWEFEYAPAEYQKLSTNGGDEDWLAFIPTETWLKMNCLIPLWMHSGTDFGICDSDIYYLADGVVVIGCHA